ncbi:EAL domain-containing response regulator [Shewanella frigidimarina]|uniref:EAL domain-containing response regulator n=1 Tax=Shewanella frigidimarina TaxID=56812 RepID=UPI003FA02B48
MTNKLLIVDDEVAILRALERVFTRAGYTVFKANSGQDALSIMAQENCQVIISDFRMPMMNGYELLAAIKAQYPASLCMILSGFTDFNSILALLNSGTAFRFLQKPWDEPALISEVVKAFYTYHQQFQEYEVNQLMANSAEALIELYPNGQLGRLNGVAKQIFNFDSSSMILTDVFPYCTPEFLLRLFSESLDKQVLQTSKGKNIEMVLKKVTEKSRFFEFHFINKNDGALSNRKQLASFLDQNEMLRSADALLLSGQQFAMIAIHLKNYNYWSEMIGLSVTEKLFDDIASTLLSQSKQLSSSLAFLTNEHFILLLDNFGTELDLHKQLTDFIAPFNNNVYSEKSVRVELVITYCIANEDGDISEQLLSNVLISNRLHSIDHANVFMRYDASLIEQKRNQLLISKALFHAIDNEQLFLHFQPKFDLNQRKITSCEVLLRWDHPELGSVSPAIFIPIAEQEGQIIELGYWVIEQSCLAISNWMNKGLHLDKVAINISGKQLSQADFIPRVKALLARFDINMSNLEFELTESWLVDNIEQSVEKLIQLKNSGISIAIDDFGTGYSSLSYLSKLPVDVLKIDRSLIIDISSNVNTQSMVGNITRMAHDLGMKVVVEGVEQIEQIKILEQLKCDVIQGFIIARPQAEDSFAMLMSDADVLISAVMDGI